MLITVGLPSYFLSSYFLHVGYVKILIGEFDRRLSSGECSRVSGSNVILKLLNENRCLNVVLCIFVRGRLLFYFLILSRGRFGLSNERE